MPNNAILYPFVMHFTTQLTVQNVSQIKVSEMLEILVLILEFVLLMRAFVALIRIHAILRPFQPVYD
jgi:hypothetical protein